MKTVLNGDNFFLLFEDAVNCHTEEAWLQKKKSDLDNFLLIWVQPYLPISWCQLLEALQDYIMGIDSVGVCVKFWL